MNRYYQSLLMSLTLVSALMSVVSVSSGQGLPTRTIINGTTLISDTTWGLAGSPYEVLGDVRVPADVTLTIEAGVEVRFAARDGANLAELFEPAQSLQACHNNAVELIVDGTLDVQGVEGSPVTLRSTLDEPSLATCTSGANQYWGGILMTESSVVSASYLELRHAYHGIYLMKGPDALLLIDHSRFINNHFNIYNEPTPSATRGNSVLVEDSEFLNFSGNAITSRGGEVTIQRVVIANSANLLNYTPRALRLHDDDDDNSYFAADRLSIHRVDYLVDNVKSAAGSLMSLTNSIFSEGQLRGSYSDPMALSGNVYYNAQQSGYQIEDGAAIENPLFVDPNQNDLRVTHRSIALKPMLTGDAPTGALDFDGTQTLKLTGHIYDTLTLAGGEDHFIEGDLTVEPSAELIIEAGARVSAVQSDVMRSGINTTLPELTVYGVLSVQSTEEAPVVFNSINDSSRWRGIQLRNGVNTQLNYVSVNGAEVGIDLSENSSLTWNHGHMERCTTNGITSADGSNTTITHSMFDRGACGSIFRDGAHSFERTIWYQTSNTAVRTIFDEPTSQLVMRHNTVHNVGGYAIDYGSSFPLANDLRDNSIVHTSSYQGVYVRSARLKMSHSNIWSSSTSKAPFTGDLVVNDGEDFFYSQYNPLYADPAQLNFEPTEFSPLIGRASDGGDIGAIPHDGALTGQRLFGWLHDDLVLSPDDGPVDIIGDLIVPEGVTLTIEPGTTIRFARADLMVSGEDRSRVELIVFGRLIAQGLEGQRITMTSAQNSPAANDWYGVRVVSSDAGNVFQNVDIRYARRAVSWDSDAQVVLSGLDSRDAQEWHIEARGAGPFLINNNRLQRGEAGILIREDHVVNGASVPTPTVSTISRNIITNINGRSIRVDTNHREAQSLIDHNTIHQTQGNNTAVYVYQRQLDRGVEVSNNIFSVQYNAVVGGGSSSFQPSAHHNCYFDTRSTAFSGARDENNFNGSPLFVDPANDNFALSPESSCIDRDENGEDTGAVPSTGAEPSAGNIGYIRTDRTIGPGEVVLRGDIIVSAGATLTILPGTELLIEVGDQMKRGRNTTRVEIVIEDQGTLRAGGGLEPARILSTPPSASATGWHGIVVEPGGVIERFENVELKNMYVGAQIYTTGEVNFKDVTWSHFYYGALELYGDDGLLTVNIDDSLIIGGTVGDDYGVRLHAGAHPPSDYNNHQVALRSNNTTLLNTDRYAYQLEVGNQDDVLIRQNTILNCGRENHGLYIRSTDISGDVEIANSIISNWGTGSGIYVSGPDTPNVHHSIVWSPSRAQSNINLPHPETTLQWNPLFVDSSFADADVRITHRSPARSFGDDGNDLGSVPFDGAQTPSLMGWLHEDVTLRAGEENVIVGDIFIPKGRRLTVEAGTDVLVRNTDQSSSGAQRDRAEIIVNGYLDLQGSRRDPVVLRSFKEASNGSGGLEDWGGILITGAETPRQELSNFTLKHARYGVVLEDQAEAEIDSATFIRGREVMVWAKPDAGELIVDRVTMSDFYTGVKAENRSLRVSSSVFHQFAATNRYGVDLSPAGEGSEFVIIHNTFDDGYYGVRATRDAGERIALINNSFSDLNTDILRGSLDPEVMGNNSFGNTAVAYQRLQIVDESNKSVEPGYVDAESDDYRLLETSELIDQGVASADILPTDRDRIGQSRQLPGVEGGQVIPDVGAYEYNVSGLIALSIDPQRLTQGQENLTLTFTGQGFDESTTVSLGDNIEVVEVNALGEDLLEAVVSVGLNAALGLRDVTVSNNAEDSVIADGVSIISAPSVVEVAPEGIIRGETTQVTLTGARFLAGAEIIVDGAGVVITNVNLANSAELRFRANVASTAAEGPRSITINNPDGGFTTATLNILRPQPLPIVSSIAPAVVSAGQANIVVTVAGQHFQEGAQVDVAGDDLTVVETVFNDAESLTFTLNVNQFADLVPRAVRVINPDGGEGELSEALTITSELSLTSLSRDTLEPGFDRVAMTVSGRGFRRDSEISFVGANDDLDSITVVGSTYINARSYRVYVDVSEDATLGGYTVVMTAPDGAEARLEDSLNVVPSEPPQLTSLSPASIPRGVIDSTVTVNGRFFNSDCVVSVSGPGVTVSDFVFISSREATINVSVAADAPLAARDVTVSLGQRGETTLLGGLTITDQVLINTVTPSDLTPGMIGAQVTLEGLNFVEEMSYALGDALGGGIAVTNSRRISAEEVILTVDVPEDTALGAYDLSVSLFGQELNLTPEAVQVITAPSFTALNPASLKQGASAQVTLTGAGFDAAARFEVEGVQVEGLTVQDANTMTATLRVPAALVAGAKTLTLVTGGGLHVEYPEGFTVDPAPVVYRVDPRSIAKGTIEPSVEVLGAGFSPDLVWSSTASDLTVREARFVSSTLVTLDVEVDAGAPSGPRDLVFSSADGVSVTTANALLVFDASDEDDPYRDLCSRTPQDPLCAICSGGVCPENECELYPDLPHCQGNVCEDNPLLPECVDTPAGSGVAEVLPRQLFFIAELGGGASESQEVAISSLVEGEVQSWSASASAPWINLTQTSGVTPEGLSVSVNPAGLGIEDGPHLGNIAVTINGGEVIEVEVSAQIVEDATPGPVLAVVPNIISVRVIEGEQMSPAVLQVTSLDQEIYPFTTLTRDEGLTVTPAIGETPQLITLSVDTTGLTASRIPYNYRMQVIAPDLEDSPMDVSLRINVLDPAEAGQLESIPRVLSLSAAEGSDQSVSDVVRVSTAGNVSRPFAIDSTSADWLTAEADTAQTPATIVVSADPTGFTSADSPLEGVITLRAGLESLEVPVKLYIGEVPPRADAGDTITLKPTRFTLNGSRSASSLGRDLSYAWSQVRGPEVNIEAADSATPTVNFLEGAEYVFELTVTDTEGLEASDVVVVTIEDVPPSADAGEDLSFILNEGSRSLRLFGDRSADANGDDVQYQWAQIGGPEVELSALDSATPSFSVSEAGRYSFELTAIDAQGDRGVDVVTYTVHTAEDSVPTAIASTTTERILVNLTAELDGRLSTHGGDRAELTYMWRQISGPEGLITEEDQPVAAFEAQLPGLVVIELEVSDGTHSDTARLQIIVDSRDDQVPTAQSPQDEVIIAAQGDEVLLDASGSFNGEEDPEGELLSYFWAQKSGVTTDLRPAQDNKIWRVRPVSTGVHRFGLRVSDQSSSSPELGRWVVINAEGDSAPTVTASSAESGLVGQTLTLSAAGNVDPDGDVLSYRWIQVGGPNVGLADPTAEVTSFVPRVEGVYRFALRLDDGQHLGPPALVEEVQVSPVPNDPPVAVASEVERGLVGQLITLNGEESSDPDGDELSYTWVQLEGPELIELTGSDTATPSFTASIGGEYVFVLTVDDGLLSAEDTVTVTVVSPNTNQSPVAEAGPDQTAEVNSVVTLDGRSSYDPDGDLVTYRWRLVEAPEEVNLEGRLTDAPSFTPTRQGLYTFELIVSDIARESLPDRVTIEAVNDLDSPNLPPVAVADELIEATIEVPFSLDGSGSNDPNGDPLTYAWRQVAGPVLLVIDPESVTQELTARIGGEYSFELTVSDGLLSSTTIALVRVGSPAENQAPTASAGVDQRVQVGEVATLDGSGSFDLDGDELTYQWSVVDAPEVVTLTGADTVAPSFTPNRQGRYVFELIVTDQYIESEPSVVEMVAMNDPDSVNQAPLAVAGDEVSAIWDVAFVLDGSASSDPDGDEITYQWRQVRGPAPLEYEPTEATQELTATIGGEYWFELVVHDGLLSSEPSEVLVVVGPPPPNEAPIADAGEDQDVLVGSDVTLDASGSEDPNGDELDYTWVQLEGPEVELVSSGPELALFVPSAQSVYVFAVTVSDGVFETTDEVIVTAYNGEDTENVAPVADAGEDQTTILGANTTLDATASMDPEGDPITYEWRQTAGPIRVDLDANNPNFEVYLPIGGLYKFELVVYDGLLYSEPDELLITVRNDAPNRPPVAVAGDDLDAQVGVEVSLDGANSYDLDDDELNYRWEQTDGPMVELSGADESLLTFTPSAQGSYRFRLTVSDGDLEHFDEIKVTAYNGESATNGAPVANVGEDLEVTNFELVTLDGSASSDPDGDELTYEWTLVAGPGVTRLSDETAVSPEFTPTIPGEYQFELVVSDGLSESEPARVTVLVNRRLLDADDSDGDGVLDPVDNCPQVANPSQADTDFDGQGNECDEDDDNDGVLDEDDNCPFIANEDQVDEDDDGFGALCDSDEIIGNVRALPPVDSCDGRSRRGAPLSMLFLMLSLLYVRLSRARAELS